MVGCVPIMWWWIATTSRPFLPKRLQHRRHFVGEHRDVAGDRGVVVRADERRPRVQAHARVDRRAHLGQLEIVAADRDLVDRARLLARRARRSARASRCRCVGVGAAALRARRRPGGAFADQIERRLDLAAPDPPALPCPCTCM